MNLSERLYELRKKKGYSQEEVADKLGVSRQTVSKWETGLSTPEFDKIKPLSELFDITIDELVSGEKVEIEKKQEEVVMIKHRTKSAFLLIGAIFLYFLSIIEIIVLESRLSDEVVVGIFLFICAIATCLLVFRATMFEHDEVKKSEKKKKSIDPQFKLIENIITLITLVLYLAISFITGAWFITWLMWVIFAIIMEIVKLVFLKKGVVIDED